MTKFEVLFGIKESEVKDACVLMPLIPKDSLRPLGLKTISKGRIYSSGNSSSFTLINTLMGAAFTGDAVLYLSQTKCKNLVLFGSCGLVKPYKGLDIGSLVTATECFSMESFSGLLLKDHSFKVFYPDKALVESYLKNNKAVQAVTCATLGSLKLEEDYLNMLSEKNIQVVDMECSSFFSAASQKNLKAMALFYISDIINEKPFYRPLINKDRARLSSSIKKGIDSICTFIK
jgi:purine-nucleoside phosphorylase